MFNTGNVFVEWGCKNLDSLIKEGYKKHTFETIWEFEEFIEKNEKEIFKNPEDLIFEIKEIGNLSHIFCEYTMYNLKWLNISEDSNSVINVYQEVNGDLSFEYY